jgi:thioredoxin 2
MDPVVIACPSCHALVRVPADRLDDDPRCAKCKASVQTDKPVALDQQSFDTHVSRAGFPVLVDFWAPWCGPCRTMAPGLDKLAGERRSQLQVAKVNTDENPQLSGRYGIRGIPTLILFRDGAEIARQTGAMDSASLNRWVSQALGA